RPASLVLSQARGCCCRKARNCVFALHRAVGLVNRPAGVTEEKIAMKAIVVTDQAAGTAGMKLTERPEPKAAINDVVVQIHASGFVGTELAWPATWSDRLNRDR